MNEKPKKKSPKKEQKANYNQDLQPPSKLLNPSRDAIITQLYHRPDLRVILKKIAKDSYLNEELTSELFFYLCRMPKELLIEKYENDILDYSILRFLVNSFHSKTSPFFEKIKKHEIGKSMSPEQRENYLQQLEVNKDSSNVYYDALDTVMNAINGLPLKHRLVLQLYIEHKSYQKVSEKTGIAPKYVSQMVKDAREELGKKIAAIVDHFADENFIKELFENYEIDDNDE